MNLEKQVGGKEGLYPDSARLYRSRLSGVKERLEGYTPEQASKSIITQPVSPFGISIVTGIPLFRTHDLQRDYNLMVHELKGILPNQYVYENLRTHVAFGVMIRNNPDSSGGHEYAPVGDKKEFYKEYLDIFRQIDFKPFSLKVEGIYPPGIMLFDLGDNEEELFKIRRQISELLEEKRSRNPEFYFARRDGKPDVGTGIVHATFWRPYNIDEITEEFSRYRKFLAEVNKEINEGLLFPDPIQIDEIAFIEPRVSRQISLGDYYTDEIIERKIASNATI